MLVFADRALRLGRVLLGSLVVVTLELLLELTPAAGVGICGPAVPGRTVGPNCLACWIPPTTHVDGTPIQLPLGFALYVYQATPPVPGVTPPTLTSSIFDGVRGICPALTPGQHYNLVVTAIEGTAESTPSTPFPFVFDRPRKLTGVGIR